MEYYYTQLAKTENGKLKQRVYYAIRQGLEAMEASFPVPKLETDALAEIFTFVALDHPEIFYAPTFTYTYVRGADTVEFTPGYMFKKKEIQEHQKALNARITKLTRPVADRDELEKELFVHDFILQNVRYDKLKKAYSHEIIGPLTQGVGVCEGIAKTVKVLCDALKLPCIIAFCHNNPEKGIKYRHAWNVISLGGKYYHLDATFDNTLTAGGEARYDYFNIADASIFRDHEALVWPVPACTDNTAFYYVRKKLSFTKLEEVRNRVSQAVKKNRSLTFHWRGGYLTRDVLKEICAILEDEGAKKNKAPVLSLNWPQAVFRVRFEDVPASSAAASAAEASAPPGEHTKISLEEANEGEKE